ncbi:hypothetical protein MJG53_017608 [Ovis ammon polii x Ovis aries]|uniref:Uncharacterized protein n=1 Tax=Ovis ammon polii x Ovis aries TaxID=2918886 RepID=A0ACB9U888_9CETA|nr:hypothetical protein MJG53_017608 [Ovis ammon polii x Ovis aries]
MEQLLEESVDSEREDPRVPLTYSSHVSELLYDPRGLEDQDMAHPGIGRVEQPRASSPASISQSEKGPLDCKAIHISRPLDFGIAEICINSSCFQGWEKRSDNKLYGLPITASVAQEQSSVPGAGRAVIAAASPSSQLHPFQILLGPEGTHEHQTLVQPVGLDWTVKWTGRSFSIAAAMGRKAETRSAGGRAAGQDAMPSSAWSLVIRKCEKVTETASSEGIIVLKDLEMKTARFGDEMLYFDGRPTSN